MTETASLPGETVDRSAGPPSPEFLPTGQIEIGNYRLRFARTAQDLDRLLALRFEVFNLELGEGLEESFATGRDTDRFDASCHHMLVEEVGGGLIGTYRMQTAAMAARGCGFYSAGEYDLGRAARHPYSINRSRSAAPASTATTASGPCCSCSGRVWPGTWSTIGAATCSAAAP